MGQLTKNIVSFPVVLSLFLTTAWPTNTRVLGIFVELIFIKGNFNFIHLIQNDSLYPGTPLQFPHKSSLLSPEEK